MISLQEMTAENSRRSWQIEGPNRLVKVVNSSGAQALRRYESVKGYVTQEKYLYGKTSIELERLLGLRPGELALGAYVYSLKRLPVAGEVEFRLSLAFPGGRVFGGDEIDAAMSARRDYQDGRNLYERSHSPTAQYYPPGSAMIPQWEITKPVPLGGLVCLLAQGCPFPRASGSTKDYTPHNRGPVR